VIADHISNKAGQADHSPIMLRLTVVQSSQGKWLIKDQKDVTSTLIQEQKTNTEAGTTSGVPNNASEPATPPQASAAPTQATPSAVPAATQKSAPVKNADPEPTTKTEVKTEARTETTPNPASEAPLPGQSSSNGSDVSNESSPPQAVP